MEGLRVGQQGSSRAGLEECCGCQACRCVAVWGRLAARRPAFRCVPTAAQISPEHSHVTEPWRWLQERRPSNPTLRWLV